METDAHNPDVTDVGCPSCDYGLPTSCTCEPDAASVCGAPSLSRADFEGWTCVLPLGHEGNHVIGRPTYLAGDPRDPLAERAAEAGKLIVGIEEAAAFIGSLPDDPDESGDGIGEVGDGFDEL